MKTLLVIFLFASSAAFAQETDPNAVLKDDSVTGRVNNAFRNQDDLPQVNVDNSDRTVTTVNVEGPPEDFHHFRERQTVVMTFCKEKSEQKNFEVTSTDGKKCKIPVGAKLLVKNQDYKTSADDPKKITETYTFEYPAKTTGNSKPLCRFKSSDENSELSPFHYISNSDPTNAGNENTCVLSQDDAGLKKANSSRRTRGSK